MVKMEFGVKGITFFISLGKLAVHKQSHTIGFFRLKKYFFKKNFLQQRTICIFYKAQILIIWVFPQKGTAISIKNLF